MICPHADSCSEISQRGVLEDHLRYRCEGTLVACQYAGAGCSFRGPNKKVREHQADCGYKKEGGSNTNSRFCLLSLMASNYSIILNNMVQRHCLKYIQVEIKSNQFLHFLSEAIGFVLLSLSTRSLCGGSFSSIFINLHKWYFYILQGCVYNIMENLVFFSSEEFLLYFYMTFLYFKQKTECNVRRTV